MSREGTEKMNETRKTNKRTSGKFAGFDEWSAVITVKSNRLYVCASAEC